jgi:hypothetical protein
MDTTRRGFFRLAAGAAAVAALPVSFKAAADVPMIWADGIHNDAPGLNALIRGDAVQFFRPELADKIGWRGNVLDFGGQWFRCEEPVIFGEEGKEVRYLNVESTADVGLVLRGRDIAFAQCHISCLEGGGNIAAVVNITPPRPFVPDGPSAYCLTYGGE